VGYAFNLLLACKRRQEEDAYHIAITGPSSYLLRLAR
jgi:hypothetical protein